MSTVTLRTRFTPTALTALALISGAIPERGLAQERGAPPLDEIIVRGRDDSLVGVANSAAQGTVGVAQIETRPLARPGELLETVPGVILTQHSGAGKANQFFLRGFNLDHGTDFATSVNGVPVNLPSHGHGQGYTDLNFVIPELVERVDYSKGVYSAAQGDFSSAGAADMEYYKELPAPFAQLQVGSFAFTRGVAAASPKLGAGTLLLGMELFTNDGPWQRRDDYDKVNALARYSQGTPESGWSATASGYHGKWNATDQIPLRALDELPGFDRFDGIGGSEGGDSQKYQLQAEWHRRGSASASELLLYGFYQDLELFSNFTYFAGGPAGDQFEQLDERRVVGARASHTLLGELGGMPMENSVGLQLRGDLVENGLFQTTRRRRTAVTRRDDVRAGNAGVYVESKLQWSEQLRSVVGVRADFFRFSVNGSDPAHSGTRTDSLVSPKATLIFGPWSQTELYLSGGMGFHSNDARGVNDPTAPADPLVRTYGAELGLRTALIPGVQSTVSLWWLDSDAELLFIGDAGNTESSRPSRRHGIEFANYWSPTEWLTLDADFSLSRARFRDGSPDGREIPGSIEKVVAAGIALHDLGGWFGSVRLRYFGDRPLLEDDSVRSRSTLLMSAQFGYQLNAHWTISAELFNLLDGRESEIDYFYESAPSPGGPTQNDIHFHPADPRSLRIGVRATF
jgi:hypothetical protein